ncbi:PhzF family phenazine biosynthesis protein [Xanthomonas translucens]|uniref:Phenazine biosynthesis protein PhzF n=3 Tax=Xanthomonas campestris pv. translucens TaxID=343 RepID=A0A109HGI5_XANCT|nr:PhzF family phenazine biosynthesis protein [Xanthomonas translucens]KTF39773.1 phenazine biosynthesis protein PhzF [Xanthomonas translucens pv. translucens]KWV11772.1 phenazine biosynthesis protein PhzF [Xanthomonas translucens]KWV14027.1 phenazine biosynthesis protein PhzF [Xanthomonas translucens]MCC8446522.1 PhzF family phenazine biosynthesis protein [Xanthomonas translucens pv. translucens]MCS3360873.1 PhzF family phenazine biosynthesis protein [Xanthomonas translucens pv. translucens]
MPLSVFIVDAFTSVPFKGNPAAVVPLQAWLPDALMQAIAGENNLSETAFFVRDADGVFDIRWFSPLKEIGFCGHATLASAHVIASQRLAPFPLRLRAAAVGELGVERLDDGSFEMRFPNQAPALLASVPQALLDALSIAPRAVYANQQAYIAVYADERQVRALVPDLARMLALAPRDVAVTAPGSSHDFVSRYFWPANGGAEDPVTGSIHAALAPLWAQALGKTQLTALQASARGGELGCRVEAQHVHVRGSAVQYLHGTIAL